MNENVAIIRDPLPSVKKTCGAITQCSLSPAMISDFSFKIYIMQKDMAINASHIKCNPTHKYPNKRIGKTVKRNGFVSAA